jgi:hypothetical protein
MSARSCTRSLVVAGLLASSVVAAHADEPWMFHGSAWVCDSPEHYDAAVAREKAGDDAAALRKDLASVCILVRDRDQSDIMAPFVQRLEDNGDKVKVVFMLRDERRKSFLNRAVEQVQYRGWTAANKLQPRADWLKLGN